MNHWEYLVQDNDFNTPVEFRKSLEQLGADGWELVEAIKTTPSGNWYRTIFKRPKR